MAVTGAAHRRLSANLAQVDRVVQSPILHGSESLCKLLRYLADKAMEQPGVPVKEYQVATEVFGRSGNFDPRLDSTVRVQTGRLRSKLAEYYASASDDDSVVIEIPKGAYLVIFAPRPHSAPADSGVAGAGNRDALEHGGDHSKNGPPRGIVWLLGASLAVALAVIAILALREPAPAPKVSITVPDSVRDFWKVFLAGGQDPLVVYSNAAFIGRPETGLRYFRPETDGHTPIIDHYTGVGEVQAIHDLDMTFRHLNGAIRLERGQLVSLDDVRNNNVIFVGSPSENLTLRDIPGARDFVFQRLTTTARKGDLGIFDRHPQPGGAPYYLAAASSPVVEDYALIARVPGINPSNWTLILAGITTLGTQAAAEYVSRANTLETLMKKLPRGKPDSAFEALLHVKVTRGVPVQSELVAVRTATHPQSQ